MNARSAATPSKSSGQRKVRTITTSATRTAHSARPCSTQASSTNSPNIRETPTDIKRDQDDFKTAQKKGWTALFQEETGRNSGGPGGGHNGLYAHRRQDRNPHREIYH